MTMDSNVIKFAFGVPARLPRAVPEATPGRGDSLNLRLRIERREIWWSAGRATRYWRTRIDFHDVVSSVQREGMPERRSHPIVADGDRMPLVEKWRAAIVRQLLTPAPDAASVKWKQMAMARDRFLGVKPELVQRAISDDLAFLAAHPVRQSKRRTSS
jgi:hypothetical protein